MARTRDQKLLQLARDVGEATWLTGPSASEGVPLPARQAQALVRDRLFGTDSLARGLRQLASERAFMAGAGARSEDEAWHRLAVDLERGQLQVRRIPLPIPSISPDFRLELPELPLPPVSKPEEIIIDDRALRITRCAPQLETAQRLKYTYLIRGLPSATLRISSDSFPGTVVHEVELDPGDVNDGVYDRQWNGVVTVAGDQHDKRLRPRYSPARLEIIHDEVYKDVANFTIAPLHVNAIDIEDTHFNHDRSILLPELAEVDGSEATLDERRITGLGVIYAALVHAEQNPAQKLLVIGHTDPSGAQHYNLTLSKKRAKNVYLFLFGKRDEWRKSSDAESHTDDIQTILTWQAARAGWDCDPGEITGTNNNATRDAIGRFQVRYNDEVKRVKAEGLDLPYRASIGVDKAVGPQTWGAFFDVYMHELVRLFRVEGVSEVEAKMAALVQFESLPKHMGCGEHVPFESGRREPFAADDERERPEEHPSDRRVELLFFDDDEQPDLVCHTGNTCDPTNCPLYTTGEYRHYEIGVPRGLQIGEVVIDLYFEDPGGERHRLPAGLEVEVTFDDDSSQTHTLEANARVQFVTARNKSAFGFSIALGEDRYMVLAPDEAGELVAELLGRDEALAKVEEGGRFFKVPERIDSHDCEWRVPDDVAFEDGLFIELDDLTTQIGTRVAPAAVVLRPRWQHFRFEYFDRWRLAPSSVPLPRVKDTPLLVLEGHLAHGDYDNGPTDPAHVESVWDLEVGEHTLHCLAWVQREAGEPARGVPDGECLVRFTLPESTFIRTDGPPDADPSTRTIETIATGHAHHDDVSRAGVERLRYYDLPQEWWSRSYYARLDSEAPGDRRHFQTITAASSSADPYVIGLDDLVLCFHRSTHNPFHPPRGVATNFVPSTHYTWEDDDECRFTLWSATLEPYHPGADDTSLTDVTQLAPAPTGPVVLDHPPFTRLITRGIRVFDVFDARTVRNTMYDGVPLGARMARTWNDPKHTPFFSFDPNYESPRADDTRGVSRFNVGNINTMLLRCCGQDEGRELFRVAQYASVWFDFSHPAPIKGKPIKPPVPAATALAEIRLSLLDSMKRWNGQDATNNQPAVFEVGPAEAPTAIGPFHALLVRGVEGPLDHDYRINIVADVRASMATKTYWKRADMQIGKRGKFTAAHEWGHAFGNPDHYIETADNASLHAEGIRDRFRSPGCPYAADSKGMMNGGTLKPRGYDMWHLALWIAEHGFVGESELAVRQTPYRYTTTVTPRDQDRSRFPAVSRVAHSVGASGLCDLFVYAAGVDGFNGGDGLHGATLDAPWDLIVICRVKMAVTFRNSEYQSYRGGMSFLREVQDAIRRVFNRERRLLARGTFAGRPVRARVLFSPRFISRTFPTGTDAGRAKYLKNLPNSPTTAAAYKKEVKTFVSENLVHAEIVAAAKPRKRGITKADANPRHAKLDTEELEYGAVEIFGQLIGLSEPADPKPGDYAPLMNALAPEFTHTSLEFVP